MFLKRFLVVQNLKIPESSVFIFSKSFEKMNTLLSVYVFICINFILRFIFGVGKYKLWRKKILSKC